MRGLTRTRDIAVSPLPDRVILRFVGAYAAAFVVFGFVVDGPVRVLHAMRC
jgi:hypothetical protein